MRGLQIRRRGEALFEKHAPCQRSARQQRDTLAALIRRVLGPDALREDFRVVREVEAEPGEAGRAAIADGDFVVDVHAEIVGGQRLAQAAGVERDPGRRTAAPRWTFPVLLNSILFSDGTPMSLMSAARLEVRRLYVRQAQEASGTGRIRVGDAALLLEPRTRPDPVHVADRIVVRVLQRPDEMQPVIEHAMTECEAVLFVVAVVAAGGSRPARAASRLRTWCRA